MTYFLISGIVRELQISEKHEDISGFSQARNGLAAAGIVAAALDSPTNSIILSNSRNDAAIRMQFFTCCVGEYRVKGRFYKIGFQEGDDIEFVVQRADELYEVYGACDPARKLIWTLPYRTRGHEAQKYNDMLKSLTYSVCFGFFFTIAWTWQYFGVVINGVRVECFSLAFIMMFALNSLVRRHFYDYSYQATAIFDAFGFEDPSNVNLQKMSKKILRSCGRGKDKIQGRLDVLQFYYEK